MATLKVWRLQTLSRVSHWKRLRLAGSAVSDARPRCTTTECPTMLPMYFLPCVTCGLHADGATCALLLQVRHYAKKKGKTLSAVPLDSGVIDMAELSSSMDRAVNALKWEFTYNIIARLTPAVLDQLQVECQGSQLPLKQLGQVTMPNQQTIIINLTSQPEAINAVVKSIKSMGRGLNPIPEDKVVRVPIPKMSKETRDNLVKLAKTATEKCKVGIRRTRQKGIGEARKAKGEVSDDEIKRTEKQIQTLTEDYTRKLENLLEAKTKELLGA